MGLLRSGETFFLRVSQLYGPAVFLVLLSLSMRSLSYLYNNPLWIPDTLTL